MGIDRDFADFLLGARNLGVDFGRTATLGRLNLFVDHRSLAAVLRRHGEAATDHETRHARVRIFRGIPAASRRRETISVDASGYEAPRCCMT